MKRQPNEKHRSVKKRKLDAPPVSTFESLALKYQLWTTDGRARRGTLTLPHAVVETPAFMPVGTHGTIKMIPSELVEKLGPRLILGNTYHLGSRPGPRSFESGTLHKFMGWNGGLLTDSGGFQMVSLSKLSEMSEEGVEFVHPETNEKLLLTPEKSIKLQNCIGADIIMALDDVVSAVEPSETRLAESVDRTTRWLDRCITAHAKPESQNLWPIIQGGLHPHLRLASMTQLKSREAPGYAIGGLSGGEAKSDFWRMVEICTRQKDEGLPENRTRYLMGVGYTIDVLVSVALGCDLFDCVYPTRTARFGTALSDEGMIRLRKSKYATDFGALTTNCDCYTCKNFTRAFIHHGINQPSILALLTVHNLRYMHLLGVRIRDAIERGKLPELIRTILAGHYAQDKAPGWVKDALAAAGIEEAKDWFVWDDETNFKCGLVPHDESHKNRVAH
eukprot:Gregarina_sp_Poly_1__11025@NODE_87_length_15225_cov_52_775630_g75_i0_p5_GENE_NODE_87_length_15225_cov_52_775630_g75_i0NODE_87_length_15225_cov_52_775630_g75_i0_p5_ORF_typecomplete_len447_score53_89TGT/PF01702_18/1_6e120_NODE_87_length_15225_cov_52_775630_g75_i081989538